MRTLTWQRMRKKDENENECEYTYRKKRNCPKCCRAPWCLPRTTGCALHASLLTASASRTVGVGVLPVSVAGRNRSCGVTQGFRPLHIGLLSLASVWVIISDVPIPVVEDEAADGRPRCAVV